MFNIVEAVYETINAGCALRGAGCGLRVSGCGVRGEIGDGTLRFPRLSLLLIALGLEPCAAGRFVISNMM